VQKCLIDSHNRSKNIHVHKSFMKALSIQQPWAWAIIYAGKNVENRSRRTNFRGTFAVHASAKSRSLWAFPSRTLKPPPKDEWPLGAIIGFVDLIDCIEQHRSKWYQPGFFGYVLANPRPLKKPIQCKGILGFWEVPTHILRRCRI
jgi:hypothetical protein